MNEVAVKSFYENNEVYTWYGMRVMAVDGSRLVLPNHQTVKEEFGVHKFGPNADSERSLALCSVFYDVLNLLAIDSQIAPYASSERDLLYQHLDYAMENDLLLLDRGYPSMALFFLLLAKKLHFCVRMKDDWWLEVDKFKTSGMKEKILTFKLPKKDRKLLKEYPEWHEKEIKCRLIRIELQGGESEILCTSLTDMEKYMYDDFEELYHYRWNEEEAYKMLKYRVEVEIFQGKQLLQSNKIFMQRYFY